MSGRRWLAGDRAELAEQRILDAAGACFAARGVGATTITDIARRAGCSRPTIYRYFDDRQALLTAFVHRAARRLGAEVAATVRDCPDPADRVVVAVQASVEGVRADPTLAAWFAGGATGAFDAATSEVIEAQVAALLGDPADDRVRDRARWVVRAILSLLAMPGRDGEDERAMLARYLAPVVVEGVAERVSVRRA